MRGGGGGASLATSVAAVYICGVAASGTGQVVADAAVPEDSVPSILVAVAGTLIIVAVAVLLLFNCAGKTTPSSKAASPVNQRADDFVSEELRNTRANSVAMEANPLYEIKKRRESRASMINEEDDIDEDELANNQMSSNVMRARALTAERVKRPNLKEIPPNTISIGDVSTSAPTVLFSGDDPAWLHHNLRKGDAVKMLTTFPNKCDGLFLVRAKKQDAGMYALDVLAEANNAFSVESYLVSRTATGIFEVDGRLTKTGARSIEAVIAELRGTSNLVATALTKELPRKGGAPDSTTRPDASRSA